MITESMKKPWVKMPADEAKELLLLRARVLEFAKSTHIETQGNSLVEVFNNVVAESYWDGWFSYQEVKNGT